MRSFWNLNLIYTDFAHFLLSAYWPPCLFYETLNKGMVMSKQIVGKSRFRLNCVNLCKMLKKGKSDFFFGAGLFVLVLWSWYFFLCEHIDMFSIATHADLKFWAYCDEYFGIYWLLLVCIGTDKQGLACIGTQTECRHLIWWPSYCASNQAW